MGVEILLLIDDSDIDNLVNQRIIERAGFASKIVVKKSAWQGLEFLNETLAKNPADLPQLILLDIRMPDLDGFGFLEEFKKLDVFIQELCKIALLTSSIDSDDFRRASENPLVKKFLNKPLTAKALAELKL